MKKKYLITGGAGFIGSRLCYNLIKENHYIVTIDNLKTGRIENIPKGVKFINAELGNENCLNEIEGECFDYIIHLAGQSSGEVSFDDPIYDLKSNTLSTLQLIQYAIKTKVKHFVYASSMSVYGHQEVEMVNEDLQCNPLSFYGIGKLASENYLSVALNIYGLRSTSLRFFNVYGPFQNLDNLKQGMVSIYLAQIFRSGEIVVKGSLDRFRDFIYVDDVVNSILSSIENPKTFGKSINIGTGVKTTVADLLNAIFNSYGKRAKVLIHENTKGDQVGIYADITKMKKLVGYTSKVSLQDGIDKMVNWVRADI